MWMPTHVQVTVHGAKGLITKGKNNTNDCFVTIALGKVKFQTSVKHKSGPDVEWHEECELPIPDQGNTACIVITALHQNKLAIDEFLGRVSIPLNTFDTYEKPKSKWYTLESKSSKQRKEHKERGRLEIKVGFTVKSGSLVDLSSNDKHKRSVNNLSHVAQSIGGSLLSLSSIDKKKGLKKFAKLIGSRSNLSGNKTASTGADMKEFDNTSIDRIHFQQEARSPSHHKEYADPGVVSEDEDELNFENLSNKSSVSSLNHYQHNASDYTVHSAKASPKAISSNRDDNESKTNSISKSIGLYKSSSIDNVVRRSWDSSKVVRQIEEEPGDSAISPDLKSSSKDISVENNSRSNLSAVDIWMEQHRLPQTVPAEVLQKHINKSKNELIQIIFDLQTKLDVQKKKNRDLEDYLDDLLLRVMETTPKILQNPYLNCKIPNKH